MLQSNTKTYNKINFCSNDDIRNGDYLNISMDIVNNQDDDQVVCGDIGSLDWIVEDNSVDEIVALRTLNNIEMDRVITAIENWKNKLREGGVIKFAIDDIFVLSGELLQNRLSASDLSQIIFRSNNCKCVIDSTSLLFILDKLQLKVENQRFDGVSFYVEARKVSDDN